MLQSTTHSSCKVWAKSLDVDTDKLCFLGDGDAWWHQMMGLTQTLGGLGTRALRYSMML